MNLSRQSDLVKDQNAFGPIVIIGAGAIGSNAANTLLRMGYEINLIDPEEVGEENLAPGMFKWRSNTPKVEAVKMLAVSQGCDKTKLTTQQRSASGADVRAGGIVVIGTDSMESRRDIFRSKTEMPNLYIDARIGGKIVTVWAVCGDDPESITRYDSGLDGESEELPCGSKATAYTGGIAAAIIGWIVSQYIQGLPFPKMFHFDGFNSEQLMLGIRNGKSNDEYKLDNG